MKNEPAVVFVVVLGGFLFFLGLLPLGVVLSQLGKVWHEHRRSALILIGVVINTGLLFLLLFVTFVYQAFFWGQQ
ncbi:MAG: hypothetical protein M1401_01270 [Chloroflexi bacterium]|nr:hypothetical protein [Chloroflexota bacterium]MCL5107508.1 hypothetical protein [Chloroflexota bacterium]